MEFLYKINWLFVGLLFGLFFGLFAVLFYVPYPRYGINIDSKKLCNCIRLGFTIVFQFIYNAVFAFAGGIGLLIFFDRLKKGFLGIPELLLLLTSVIAISGKLADIIFQAPGALKEEMKNKFSGKKGTEI